MLPPADTRGIYEEFVCLYLELKHFAPHLRARYFPSIANFATVDALIAQDVDGSVLLGETKLLGVQALGSFDDQDQDYAAYLERTEAKQPNPEAYDALLCRADGAIGRGNAVRAALLRQRAFEVAPKGCRGAARDATSAALHRLTDRLVRLVPDFEEQRSDWIKGLRGLLPCSGRGIWPVEARLLFDLQNACIDHEKETYSVDLIEWAGSLGRVPLKRSLPNLKFVLPIKHLRMAEERLVSARLTHKARHALTPLIRSTLAKLEREARDHLRPLLLHALEEANLKPRNQTEKLARERIVEELVDLAINRGFLNMSDLRDAIARGALKLPDLSGPIQFLSGDQLLVANRRCAVYLDGIYHRAEVYLRGLQSLSSLAFGTIAGRLLTLYLILPLLGAFILLKGAEEVYEVPVRLAKWVTPPEEKSALDNFDQEEGHSLSEIEPKQHGASFVNSYSFSITAAFMLSLLHSARFRRVVLWLLHWFWLGLRTLFYDVPSILFGMTGVRWILQSRTWLLFYLFVLKPLCLAASLALLCFLMRSGRTKAVIVGAVAFPCAIVLLNSRVGFYLEETSADGLVRSWELLRDDLLPGVLRSIVSLFQWLGDWLQRWLNNVDEWLRFRSGDNAIWVPVKAVLGVFWFVIAYVVRFVWTVLFEPQINPIKHFPVVTVSHKVMLLALPPTSQALTQYLLQRKIAFMEQAGEPVTEMMRQLWESELSHWSLGATFTVFACIPGMFGFMTWELMSNWRLYASNRPKGLQPEVVGSHGETVLRLLRPGFHSGTLPRLFARLRRTEREGERKNFRRQRAALHHVQHEIRHFVERTLIAVLDDSKSWGESVPEVGSIDLGINRIRIELTWATMGASVRLELEQHDGWLVAGFAPDAAASWLQHLSECQAMVLTDALAGFYKLSGVDFVREQIHCLITADMRWKVTQTALIARTSDGVEGRYDLTSDGEPIPLLTSIGRGPTTLPCLEARQLFLSRCEINWDDWIRTWQRDHENMGHPTALLAGFRLLPTLP